MPNFSAHTSHTSPILLATPKPHAKSQTPTKPTTQLTIGFFHHYGLGDNLAAIKALYIAKKAYNCRLVIFGNELFKQILSYCDFLDSADEARDIGHLSEKCLDFIAKSNCDFFLLSNPRTHYIKLLERLDKPIITALKFPSLFSSKTKYPPLHFFAKFRKMRSDNALCALARLVDKNAFDEFVAKILTSQNPPTRQNPRKNPKSNWGGGKK